MSKPLILLIICLSVIKSSSMDASNMPFVKIENGGFSLNGSPYIIAGTNLWYGHLLAAEGETGKLRLVEELNRLASYGINNLRVVIDGCGPETEPFRIIPAIQPKLRVYNDQILQGLDFLLEECKLRKITVVLCLNNFWHWTGGMAQYVAWVSGEDIPYPEHTSWHRYQQFSARFYKSNAAKQAFLDFAHKIIHRENSISKIEYFDDPTIMAWQLANEPRGYNHRCGYLRWIKSAAQKIRKWAPNQLVSLGGEGIASSVIARNAFKRVTKIKHLDYLTMHCWIENWGWFDPTVPDQTFNPAMAKVKSYLYRHADLARQVMKPIVLEEFGIARDSGDYNPQSSVVFRNEYFRIVYSELKRLRSDGFPIGGSNFWAWSGVGLPPNPGGTWNIGEVFTGDPPHEPQGWYSVYAHDSTTLEIVKKFGRLQ